MKIQNAFVLVLPILFSLNCQKAAEHSAANAGRKQFDASKSDPRAVQIAEEVMVALGGYENFAAINYLAFHFVVAVDSHKTADWRHDWDRRNNSYRVEGISRDGDHLLAVFNLDSRNGVAFKNGQKLEGEEKIQLLKRAYARYINDTFWLLMPFKLKDAGAVLQYDGVQEISDVTYEVLRLSYADSVGLTPQNVYRVFVDPATRVVHRWEYFENENAAPAPAWWEQWQPYGKIKLAKQRRFDDSGRKIIFTDIVVAAEVEEKVFEAAGTSQAGVF